MLKLKHDPNKPAGRIRFVALWTLGMLLGQVMSSLLINVLIRTVSLFDLTNIVIVTSSLVLPIRAFIQVQLVERLLKHSMRGWLLYSITGFVTTLALYFMLRVIPRLEETYWIGFQESMGFYGLLFLSALLSALPTLIFQTLWLRRHVKQAWLWLLIGLGLTLVAAGQPLVIITLRGDLQGLSAVVQLLLSLLYWIVPGLAMYHMMTHSRETIKAKHDVAEDESLAEGRSHRLQEAEETAQPWVYADDAARQTKTQ